MKTNIIQLLLSQVSEEARQILNAVMKLRRKADKLQQQKLKMERKAKNPNQNSTQ